MYFECKTFNGKKIDEDYEVGEEVTDEVKLIDFGRRAILNLRQNLASKILELEKDHIYGKYKGKIGDIVTGEVYQVWKKEILVLDDEGNELITDSHNVDFKLDLLSINFGLAYYFGAK